MSTRKNYTGQKPPSNKQRPRIIISPKNANLATIQPRRSSLTTTFGELLPEKQKYYQQKRKEVKYAEFIAIIQANITADSDAGYVDEEETKKRQAALDVLKQTDKEIAQITASRTNRERPPKLKRSTTISGDLTEYNKDEDENDPDPNKTWKDSEHTGGRKRTRRRKNRKRNKTNKKTMTKRPFKRQTKRARP